MTARTELAGNFISGLFAPSSCQPIADFALRPCFMRVRIRHTVPTRQFFLIKLGHSAHPFKRHVPMMSKDRLPAFVLAE